MQRRSGDEEGTTYGPTSVAAVMTIVVPHATSARYDVCPEATSIRLGAGAALGLMIGDRALVRLAVLLTDAARAMHEARGDPGIGVPHVPSTTNTTDVP